MSIIVASRTLGVFQIDALMSENHVSELEITDNPVEDGTDVNDHSYLKPKTVDLEIVNANAADDYQALLRVQASRLPFSIITGLTVYNNMLISSINAVRDKQTAKVLSATVSLKELIQVGTQSTTIAPTTQTQAVNVAASNDQDTNDRIAATTERGDTQVRNIGADIARNAIDALTGVAQ